MFIDTMSDVNFETSIYTLFFSGCIISKIKYYHSIWVIISLIIFNIVKSRDV